MVSSRTPTCAPSTPSVSPSCQRTSSWLAESVGNVPKLLPQFTLTITALFRATQIFLKEPVITLSEKNKNKPQNKTNTEEQQQQPKCTSLFVLALNSSSGRDCNVYPPLESVYLLVSLFFFFFFFHIIYFSSSFYTFIACKLHPQHCTVNFSCCEIQSFCRTHW